MMSNSSRRKRYCNTISQTSNPKKLCNFFSSCIQTLPILTMKKTNSTLCAADWNTQKAHCICASCKSSGVCYRFTVPWCIWSVPRCSSALHHFQHPYHFWLHRIWHHLSYSSMSLLHPSTSPVSTIMIQNENTLPTFSGYFASFPWSSSYMDPKLFPHFQFDFLLN